MRQEMIGFGDGSGISWTTCKQSAPRCRHNHTITSNQFLQAGFSLPNQQCQSTVGHTPNKWRNKTKESWQPLQVYLKWRKNVKVAHTRLLSIGFWSWSRFLAVSLQVTWIINPTVGCHYFPPGLQLPPQPLRGLLPVLLLGEERHNGCEQFA